MEYWGEYKADHCWQCREHTAVRERISTDWGSNDEIHYGNICDPCWDKERKKLKPPLTLQEKVKRAYV